MHLLVSLGDAQTRQTSFGVLPPVAVANKDVLYVSVV